jgi:small-conductance mechanosensitive channel/CRP-like cAMP-binding protein
MDSSHSIQQLIEGLVLGGVALVALLLFRNRVIRRRMVFTLVVVAAVLILHFAADFGVFGLASGGLERIQTAEKILVSFAVINSLVALFFNPWFSDRVRDRAPAIVQDALVIGLFLVVAMFFYQEDATKLFATSAIAAAVLGFALQETLGNAFAGLAIQTEKPFRVGHWVAIAAYQGRVVEVTWRATKIRTKDGNLVVLPNNVVAREAINNYTEPAAATRLSVDVGATYSAPPNQVRDAILTVLRRTSDILAAPKPGVQIQDFAGSAITYRALFWIEDFEKEELVKDRVRNGIYYEFARRNIEIPWPIQVEYSREETHEAPDHRLERHVAMLARVPVLASLFVEGRRALASGACEHMYADGEVIVREGEPGASMFIVCRGEVRVTIADGREVARTRAGGYFGEMSLLTGEPRSATVSAAGDCTVLEIKADTFKEYVTAHPEVIEHLAGPAAERRRELDQTRAAASAVSVETRLTVAGRMRRFFGLD